MISGQFSGTGQSEDKKIGPGPFNLSVDGGSGTVVVERSFDGGATWKIVKTVTTAYEGIGYEAEFGTRYRLNCTVYTSGPITYRIGDRQS